MNEIDSGAAPRRAGSRMMRKGCCPRPQPLTRVVRGRGQAPLAGSGRVVGCLALSEQHRPVVAAWALTNDTDIIDEPGVVESPDDEAGTVHLVLHFPDVVDRGSSVTWESVGHWRVMFVRHRDFLSLGVRGHDTSGLTASSHGGQHA